MRQTLPRRPLLLFDLDERQKERNLIDTAPQDLVAALDAPGKLVWHTLRPPTALRRRSG